MKLIKKLLKRKLLAITIIVVLFSAWVTSYFVFQNYHQENLVVVASEESLFPIHLKIPEININADIETVGLTQNGEVASPEGPLNVAWYEMSHLPGEIGSAVIDGHSGWKDDIKAVFDDLYKLKIGDKVYIESDTGVVTTFVVRELQTYNSDEFVPGIFISDDGKSHLNLITCGGFWDEKEKSHSSRLVVFTDKE